MTTVRHQLHPLARALLRASTMLLLTSPAMAVTIVDGELAIDAGTARDNYRLNERARLEADGASTDRIVVGREAQLDMRQSTVITAGFDAIALSAGASANISGNSRLITDRLGLNLLRTGTVGSTATVTDSYVEGGRGGARISATSTLNLQRSSLVGTGSAAAATLFGSAVLNAEDSSLIGASNGLLIFADPDLADPAKVNLIGSRVEGLDGSAIVVGNEFAPANANIEVSAGSSLVGSNGTLLEVVGNSTATMTVDNSDLVGDVRVEAGSSAKLALNNNASLTGRLENVEAMALNSGARWNMVEDSQLGELSMNGGSVRFGEADQYQRLTLGSLAGDGTFVMDADFSTGDTDFLEVTGTATGDHSVLVGSSGADPLSASQLHLIQTGGGDASFALAGGPVDLGAFSYELVQRGNDWFLDGSSKIISPGTASVLALFNTAPTIWYGELSSLRARMGELRLDERKSGGWMRAYGNKFNVAEGAGTAYQQVQQGVSFGADAPLPIGDGQWLAGVLGGYSSSDLNIARGASAEVKSYYLGGYVTWLDAQSGYYFDGVLKVNRFDNSADVTLSDGRRTQGNYDNLGVGATVEFGRHIDLADGYFVEPYTQWSAVAIQGKDYQLDNGLSAEGEDTRSLLGKAGATVGRTFDLGQGKYVQPYVRLAYAHEFVGGSDVEVNGNRFDNDLSGSRGEVGAGVAVSLTERMQLHADFDYSNGKHIEQPWGANVGLHYSW
ncbi:autotransporter outer membrane beta-barrel domain-containing protein [Pseudomonas hunanensis]|nr:autotransporter outer membrane beta-barrel domain-containing protein [Pseudomonas hunanensis]